MQQQAKENLMNPCETKITQVCSLPFVAICICCVFSRLVGKILKQIFHFETYQVITSVVKDVVI